MSTTEIIALIATCVGVISFALVITVLYKNYIGKTLSETEEGRRDIELIDKMIYEKEKRVQRRHKVISIAKDVVYYVFLVISIPLLAFAIYSRVTNGVVMVGDSSAMVVASGSMSAKNPSNDYLLTFDLNDQFNTYDLIVLKKVNEHSLRKYDVIAYRNDKNVNIIHRIVDIETANGSIRYVTRGDANNVTDSYHPRYEDVIGKYTGKRIPTIGIFVSFFQSYAGIVTVSSLIYCLWSIDWQNKKLEDAEEERKEILLKAFDFSSMNENTCFDMASGFESRVYYQGYCYKFSDKGFLSKEEMTIEEKKEFMDQDITKVIRRNGGEKKVIFSSLLDRFKKKDHQRKKEESKNDEKND